MIKNKNETIPTILKFRTALRVGTRKRIRFTVIIRENLEKLKAQINK